MPRLSSFSLLCAVLATLSACHTPPPKALERRFTYAEHVEYLELFNGMWVLVAPDEHTNLISVDMRFAVGAADDPAGHAGLAHLVEHLRYQLRLDEESTPVDALLASKAIEYNAFTDWEYTHYKTIAPSEALEDILKIEFGRLAADCSALPEGVVAREREVVRNELRQRDTAFVDFLRRVIYPAAHPYSRSLLGDDEQVASIERDVACAFLEKHYTTSRASLVISGNVRPEEVRQLLNQRFAGTKPAKRVPARRLDPIALPKRTDVHRVHVDRPHAIVAFALPPTHEPEGQLAKMILAELARELDSASDDEPFIKGSGTLTVGGTAAPIALIYVGVHKPEQLAKGVAFIRSRVSELRTALLQVDGARGEGKPSSRARRELQRILRDAKLEAYKSHAFVRFASRIERLWNRGTSLSDHLYFTGSSHYIMGDLERLISISPDSVRKLADELLEVRHAIHLIPDESGTLSGKRSAVTWTADDSHDLLWTMPVDESEASTPLEVGTTRWQERVAKTRTFVLDNGLEVALYPATDAPVVDIRLTIGAGAVHAPRDHAGIARLAASLLSPDEDHTTWHQALALFDFRRLGGTL